MKLSISISIMVFYDANNASNLFAKETHTIKNLFRQKVIINRVQYIP